MSISLAISIATILLAAASVAMSVYTRRVYRRRVEELEDELTTRRLAEQIRMAVVSRIAAQAGADLVEPVRVEDIKYGDKMCWHPEDMSDHQHYVAGYDGDPGPSTDGIHARKITPKGL